MGPTTEREDFNKEFSYLYDNCIISKQKIVIGKFMLEHPELFNASKNSRNVVIDALFHSAAINLWKIGAVTEQLNVVGFGNRYSKKSTKEDKEKWKKLKKKLEKNVEIISPRRNKSLAHSDRDNIKIDMQQEYPLYVGTLEETAMIEEEILEHIYSLVESVQLSGIDKETGEHFTLIDFNIKKECKTGIMYAKQIAEIQKYMKENHLEKMVDIIYSAKEN